VERIDSTRWFGEASKQSALWSTRSTFGASRNQSEVERIDPNALVWVASKQSVLWSTRSTFGAGQSQSEVERIDSMRWFGEAADVSALSQRAPPGGNSAIPGVSDPGYRSLAQFRGAARGEGRGIRLRPMTRLLKTNGRNGRGKKLRASISK